MADAEEKLVRDARGGDDEAMARLLELHLPGLRTYVRLRSGPALRAREASTDLVQSVCREVLEQMDEVDYRGEVAFRHWLYRVAERKVIDKARFHRRAKRDVGREKPLAQTRGDSRAQLHEGYATLVTPSQELMSMEEIERVEQAFDRLPERYRNVIVLSRIVGLSSEELGRELDCSPAYARTLLARAVARLARILGFESP